MEYHYIDMDNYARKEHFAYFRAMANPFVGVTVNVDITSLLKTIKKEGLPFFLTINYIIGRAANAVVQFRQRIKDDKIIEFASCPTSHTEGLKDGTYGYCVLAMDKDFKEYLPYALKQQAEARCSGSIAEPDVDAMLQKLFVSCLPWLAYSALIQPTAGPCDSNPRITWGKYFENDGKILLPLSVLCHHALVDGAHVAKFYEEVEKEMLKISELYGE